MFNRAKYKAAAREQLRNRWKTPVLMTLVSGIIVFILQLPNSVMQKLNTAQTIHDVQTSGSAVLHYSVRVAQSNLFSLLQLTGACIFGIILFANVTVYMRMAGSYTQVTFDDFIAGFAKWVRGLLAYLWFALWVLIWMCVFIFPGIVKAYAYSQMFFILAEYPGVNVRQAMRISRIITNGHKGDLFVMGLSFFGWMLLCGLSCGIGYLWLIPYMSMSYTNAYKAMKEEALHSGRLSTQDLFSPDSVFGS